MGKTTKSFSLPTSVKNNTPIINLDESNAKAIYHFEFIPYDKIKPSILNKDFSQDEIEELALSIKVNGLLHNFVVVPDTEDIGMYRLISGERRWRAIGTFTKDELKKNFPMGLPSKIEKQSIDEIDEEIRLREANRQRDYTQEQIRENILRLIELYKIKGTNEDNPNFAKMVAEKTGLSERQTQKYINTERLIPELNELFKVGKLSLTHADNFSKLNESSQKYICSLYESNQIENITETYDVLRKNVEETKQENKRLNEELEKTNLQLNEKETTITRLNSLIEHAEKENDLFVPDEQTDIIKELKEAKNKAEKEYKKVKTKLENLEEEQKDLKNRNVTMSHEDYKRMINITKTEHAISQMEDQMKILKNNKDNILSDELIKNRIEILITRLKNLVIEE